MRRNLYSDRAGCERDYSPALCAPNSSYFGGEWIGPEYYEDRNAAKAKKDPGPGRAGGAVRVLQSERGGFGAVGRYLRTVG